MRNFTATAVREHLRSQLEDGDDAPHLTKKELELVQFVLDHRYSLEMGSDLAGTHAASRAPAHTTAKP